MSQYLSIIKGTDRTIKVLLKSANGAPFSLEDASEIKALFQKQDDNENLLEITKGGGDIDIVGDASRGEISITLDATATDQLRVGTRLTWEVEITRSSLKYVAQFPEQLDVLARLSA